MSVFILLHSRFRLKHWPHGECGPAAVIQTGTYYTDPMDVLGYMTGAATGDFREDNRVVESRLGWRASGRRAVAVLSPVSFPVPELIGSPVHWLTVRKGNAIKVARQAFNCGADVVALHQPQHDALYPGRTDSEIASDFVDRSLGGGGVYFSEKLLDEIIAARGHGQRPTFS